MSRIPLLAGNWKMHKTLREAVSLVDGLMAELATEGSFLSSGGREVVLCPPATALSAVYARIRGTSVRLGGQNVHWEEQGAFTGEISPAMARDAGCSYIIVGHSERRGLFHETDDMCRRKVRAVLDWGMSPLLCVGESLKERELGLTQEKVEQQVRLALREMSSAEGGRVVIAYEPIWAIGTGKTDSPAEANRTIGFIRSVLGEVLGDSTSRGIRILYGGSVKPTNIDDFMAQKEIDGALVGGASLESKSFLRIVHYHNHEGVHR